MLLTIEFAARVLSSLEFFPASITFFTDYDYHLLQGSIFPTKYLSCCKFSSFECFPPSIYFLAYSAVYLPYNRIFPQGYFLFHPFSSLRSIFILKFTNCLYFSCLEFCNAEHFHLLFPSKYFALLCTSLSEKYFVSSSTKQICHQSTSPPAYFFPV